MGISITREDIKMLNDNPLNKVNADYIGQLGFDNTKNQMYMALSTGKRGWRRVVFLDEPIEWDDISGKEEWEAKVLEKAEQNIGDELLLQNSIQIGIPTGTIDLNGDTYVKGNLYLWDGNTENRGEADDADLVWSQRNWTPNWIIQNAQSLTNMQENENAVLLVKKVSEPSAAQRQIEEPMGKGALTPKEGQLWTYVGAEPKVCDGGRGTVEPNFSYIFTGKVWEKLTPELIKRYSVAMAKQIRFFAATDTAGNMIFETPDTKVDNDDLLDAVGDMLQADPAKTIHDPDIMAHTGTTSRAYQEYTNINPSNIKEGYCVDSGGKEKADSNSTLKTYVVSPGKSLKVGTVATVPTALVFKEGDKLISYLEVDKGTWLNNVLVVPEKANKMQLNIKKGEKETVQGISRQLVSPWIYSAHNVEQRLYATKNLASNDAKTYTDGKIDTIKDEVMTEVRSKTDELLSKTTFKTLTVDQRTDDTDSSIPLLKLKDDYGDLEFSTGINMDGEAEGRITFVNDEAEPLTHPSNMAFTGVNGAKLDKLYLNAKKIVFDGEFVNSNRRQSMDVSPLKISQPGQLFVGTETSSPAIDLNKGAMANVNQIVFNQRNPQSPVGLFFPRVTSTSGRWAGNYDNITVFNGKVQTSAAYSSSANYIELNGVKIIFDSEQPSGNYVNEGDIWIKI